MLGRSLDELPPQTRRLLLLVDQMVTAECKRERIERTEYRFSRRDVRAATGWGDTQLRLHLGRLEELEYLLAHRGGRGQSFVYELVFVFEGDGSKPTMPGLIDVETLGGHRYDGDLAGVKAQFAGTQVENAGSTRGQNAGVAAGTRGRPSPASAGLPASLYKEELKNTVPGNRGELPVVAVPHRSHGSMNGNGHPAGATQWPV